MRNGIIASILLSTFLLSISCIAGGRDTTGVKVGAEQAEEVSLIRAADLAVIKAQADEINALQVQLNDLSIKARDIKNLTTESNDKWTLRLMAVGLVIMGLSYPVGKIVWIALENAKTVIKNGKNGNHERKPCNGG